MPIYTVSEQTALLGARNCVYRHMCGKGVVYTILHIEEMVMQPDMIWKFI